MKGLIDRKDTEIIDYLKDHGRDKISEISGKTGIPRATIFERITRLKNEGYIKKFTVDLDHEKLGYSVKAYIMVSFDSNTGTDQRSLARKIAMLENVLSVSIISGQWDILVETVSRSMKDLSVFVL
ncbi:MAG: Lrp/AsnC family transcriptional regulator, partial [Candidatus Thermoplasmatota archaeon]|nr:Lrp/AsnC family transcriptional regulator [Candidatus Thermoplasmatota archaeon]MCL5785981.1 Lrp/AsnC family transcriptional regulator [Candidatus Thermoplasmatota archaeon]